MTLCFLASFPKAPLAWNGTLIAAWPMLKFFFRVGESRFNSTSGTCLSRLGFVMAKERLRRFTVRLKMCAERLLRIERHTAECCAVLLRFATTCDKGRFETKCCRPRIVGMQSRALRSRPRVSVTLLLHRGNAS